MDDINKIILNHQMPINFACSGRLINILAVLNNVELELYIHVIEINEPFF